MNLEVSKVFIEIPDPEIAGVSRNVYHGGTNTLYLLKMDCLQNIYT